MGTGGVTLRHHAAVDLLGGLCARLALTRVTYEPRGDVPDRPVERPPDPQRGGRRNREGTNQGVDLKVTTRNETISVDMTVVNPAASQVAAVAKNTPLYACAVATEAKMAKYLQAHVDRGIDFHVTAVETTGAMGPGVGKFFLKIKKIIKEKDLLAPMPTSYLFPTYTAYMKRALSVCVVAETAQAMRRCFQMVLEKKLAQEEALGPFAHASQ